jgi:hypothetical protein
VSRYETACEFYDKADCEGGLAEMVLGYGVRPEDVPLSLRAPLARLAAAYSVFERAIAEWHGGECANPDEPCAR